MFKQAEVLIYSSIFDFQKKIALYGEVFSELIETLLMLILSYKKKLLAESSPRNLEEDFQQKNIFDCNNEKLYCDLLCRLFII